jgi:hypothetical protein
MRNLLVTIFLLLGLSSACYAQGSTQRWDQQEWIKIAKVPELVQQAARQAKSGLFLQRAKLVWETDDGLYIIEGSYFGQIWRVHVTGAGVVKYVTRDR